MGQKIDTSSILIERIIVHDIPKHKKGETGKEPIYSEQESKLTDGLRNFFKDKVVQSLSSDKSFKICFDEENTSPISWITNEFLNSDGSNIVTQSKAITKHLFEIQVGYNAAGILVVIFGKVNSQNENAQHLLEFSNSCLFLLALARYFFGLNALYKYYISSPAFFKPSITCSTNSSSFT